jgi:hypothetical protein
MESKGVTNFNMKKDNLNSSLLSEKSISTNDGNITEDEESLIELAKVKNLKLSSLISKVLEKIINNNKINKRYKLKRDIFTGKSLPKITLIDYINRIITYSDSEINTIICSLIYIDRINKIKAINEFNIHRIFFTAVLVSIKYNEDIIFNNDYYSKVAGVKLNEINKMELEFISLLDFNLYIDPEEFGSYKQFI